MLERINQNSAVQQVQHQIGLPERLEEIEEIINGRLIDVDRIDLGFEERTAFFPPIDLNRILSLSDEEFAELRAARFEAMGQTPPNEVSETSREVADAEMAAEMAVYLERVHEVQDEALQGITQTL